MEIARYFPAKEIAYGVMAATTCGKPLLVEGVPSAGKTSLAKTIVDMLNLPLFEPRSLEKKILNEMIPKKRKKKEEVV